MSGVLHPVDWAIIAAYLVGVTALGLYFSRRSTQSSNAYFLAGRSLRWPTIGLALFATNISTVHLIGLASSGFGDGMVVGNFEWLAATCLILLAIVFAPFYFRSRVATLPEFLEKRYGPASRTMLAFMAVIGALFIHIGVTLYAGAVVVDEFIDVSAPQWYASLTFLPPFEIVLSILVVAGLTVLYTVLGGLKAVVVTEAIQTVFLLFGAGAVTVAGLMMLPQAGVENLQDLRAVVKPQQLSMVRPDGDYAWYAMLLGYPVLGVWYWCADQTIVQRILGAKTQRDAQYGAIFAGFIKILPVFFMVLPGVIGYVLFKDKIADNPDKTLVILILQLLPTGLRGLVIAGLLAALMSTVAGALNSTATLVSIDIVKRLRPQTPDRSLVRIGQWTAVIVMLLAMAWSTQGDRFGGIFKGINQMIAVLAPPITTVFLWGVLWRRGTASASLITLILGFMLGAIAFVVDFPAVSIHLLGENADGDAIQLITGHWNIPFMLQAWWLFVTCSAIFVTASFFTKPPDAQVVAQYCWRSPLAALTGRLTSEWADPRILSAVLLTILMILYWIFA